MKTRIISVILALLLLAGLYVLVLFFNKTVTLNVMPQTFDGVNYNNYLEDNRLDYKDGTIAWLDYALFNPKLIYKDGKGEQTVLTGVRSPFQLTGSGVAYIKNGDLILKDTDSKKTVTAAEDVKRFLVFGDRIIYSALTDADNYRYGLYVYDMSRNAKKKIYENVEWFYINGGRLFAVNGEYTLFELSFDSGDAKEIIRLPVKSLPVFFMPIGEKLMYSLDGIYIFDTDTGREKKIAFSDGTYVNDKIRFICDDSRVFVSFCATKTDGSVVMDIDDDANGLWSIDPVTLEKVKICSDVFDRLYLFGDTLFGAKENGLYRIDVQTKQIKKITE